MIEKLALKIKEKSSSFLFIGPSGVGKKYHTFKLIKKILGEDKRIEQEIHPNVIFLKPKNTKIEIDDVRDLIKTLNYSPLEKNKRFIVIEDAHYLNKYSANALLKAIEEPPKDTVFILISNHLHSLPATIISRCEIIKFPPLKKEKLSEILNIKDEVLLHYAKGSVSNLNFFTFNKEIIIDFINFIKSPTDNYNYIAKLTEELVKISENPVKTKERENLEKINSLIISIILEKIEAKINDLEYIRKQINLIESINDIFKIIYTNTKAYLVLENMLLKLART
jgi:DNA polymerase III delta prime subunit